MSTIDRPYHLLPISGRDEKTLHELAVKYADYLKDTTDQIGDICFSAASAPDHFNHRFCLFGANIDDLKGKIDEFLVGSSQNELSNEFISKSSRLAFLYAGQGSQYAGMAKDLYDSYEPFRNSLDKVDRIIEPHLGRSLVELFFDPSQADLINRTDITQPAIFAVQCALTELWDSWGIKPDAVAGHSIGEYAGAVTAGIMTIEDAARLVVARGRLMHSAPGDGAMGVVFADVEEVKIAVEPYIDKVSIAAVNAPKTVTISGDSSTVGTILKSFKASGVKSVKLTVSHAFHSPLMYPILDEFREIAKQVSYSLPSTDFYSCLTGQIESDKFATSDYWTDHIAQPVMFQAGFQALESAGYRQFVEIGADTTLSGLGKRCSTQSETVILPSLKKKEANNWITILKSVSELYINGFDIDWKVYDAPYDRNIVDIPK